MYSTTRTVKKQRGEKARQTTTKRRGGDGWDVVEKGKNQRKDVPTTRTVRETTKDACACSMVCLLNSYGGNPEENHSILTSIEATHEPT